VVFHPLDKSQIHNIANIQIAYLQKRLAERDLRLQVDGSALDYLAAVGYDPVYGARPLKRVIQQNLENPLAKNILEGKFLPGDTIKVTKKNKELEFVKS
jgi:ATP-dependent Clp protease ATP-binding subunit ClpB